MQTNEQEEQVCQEVLKDRDGDLPSVSCSDNESRLRHYSLVLENSNAAYVRWLQFSGAECPGSFNSADRETD